MGWRLRWLLETAFRTLGVPLLRAIGPLFFERRYLSGRHFGRGGLGWYWVRRSLLTQRLLSYNRHLPWPASPFVTVSDPRNIDFDVDDLNNFQSSGCYFQNFAGRIVIGKGTYIAPNVGIITANHDPRNPDDHLPGRDVVIGERCWIGMNAVILPGVRLGPGTVVAACSLVTRSFRKGYVTIGGVPAEVLMTRPETPSQE